MCTPYTYIMLCQLYFSKARGGGDQMERPLRENDLSGHHGELEIKRGYLWQASLAAFCGMVGEQRSYEFESVLGAVVQTPLPPYCVTTLNSSI